MSGTTTFSLEGRGLKLTTAEDVAPYIAPLLDPSASSITSINLQGNTLGVGASEALASHFSKLTSLRVANLADIFTSRLLAEIPPALSALLQALLPLQHLDTVNLSDNAFGLNTQAPLVHFLERHTPLRHLILNNNGLGPEAGTLVANALTRLAEAKDARGGGRNSKLETIVCGRNRLENGSMAAWSRAVAAHADGLREIRMIQNGIRQEGIQTLLRDGLRKAERLRALDLQDNTFTVSAGTALADVVTGWTELEELGVGDCLLSTRGAMKLGMALSEGKNGKLKLLRLQYNEIDARGVKAIVDAAKAGSLAALQRVELNGNKFAEEDPAVEELRSLLGARADEHTDAADGEWGLDDLSDLEEDSDDEQGGDDEDDEDVAGGQTTEDKAERELKRVDEAERENVAQDKDASVDALADQLGQAEI